MNRIDLVCLLVAVVAVVAGTRLGFARRVLSWIGLIAGLTGAAALLPRLLGPAPATPSPTRLMVGTTMFVVGGVVGQVVGATIGAHAHRLLDRFHLGTADRVLGGFAGLAGVVLVLWVVLPTMADVPGWTAAQARSSVTARFIGEHLGRPPGVFSNLSSTLGVTNLPRVFEQFQAAQAVAAPPVNSPVPAPVLRTAAESTIKLVGDACGDRIQSGSGFVESAGLVLTNAHVVAGTTDLRAETPEGARHPATVVAFDPNHDLALVRVPDLGRPALPLGTAGSGDTGSVVGYPGGGPQRIDNYRISARLTASGRDIYDRNTVDRRIFVMGSGIGPGDSGGPLVDPAGAVVGVAFAVAPDKPGTAYAITSEEVRTFLSAASVDHTVSVGPCTS